MIRRSAVMLSGLSLVAAVAIAQSPLRAPGSPRIARRPASAPMPESGAALFAYHCASCHGDGPGHPGTAALAFKYEDREPASLIERGDIDPDTVKLFVRNGINAMPFFRKTEIGDAELDRIARYVTETGKAHAAHATRAKR